MIASRGALALEAQPTSLDHVWQHAVNMQTLATRTDLLPVVEGEHVIGPSVSLEDPMRPSGA